MGFGGRLAHRSCLCMGENEPILYVMASRRGEKKNIAFFFVFLGMYIRGKQKKGVKQCLDRAPPEIGNKISRDDMYK